MVLGLVQLPAGVDVPKPCPAVGAARGEAPAVGADRECGYLAIVCAPTRDPPAICHYPNFDLAVDVAECDTFAVAVERYHFGSGETVLAIDLATGDFAYCCSTVLAQR